MSIEPLPLEIQAALSMSGLPGQPLRVALHACIERAAAPPGHATKLPARYVASWCGMHHATARHVLRELVDRWGVLERDAGAGQRAHAFRFAAIQSWRVPWVVHPDAVLRRLLEVGVVARGTSPNAGVVPRYSAGQFDIVPRYSAALKRASAALERGTSRAVVPRYSAAQRRADAAASPSLSRESSSLSLSLGSEGVSEEEHAQPLLAAV